jgi:hypothetical protein
MLFETATAQIFLLNRRGASVNSSRGSNRESERRNDIDVAGMALSGIGSGRDGFSLDDFPAPALPKI